MGAAGRERVIANFDWANSARLATTAYNQLLSCQST
jgi:hypothetical protein